MNVCSICGQLRHKTYEDAGVKIILCVECPPDLLLNVYSGNYSCSCCKCLDETDPYKFYKKVLNHSFVNYLPVLSKIEELMPLEACSGPVAISRVLARLGRSLKERV